MNRIALNNRLATIGLLSALLAGVAALPGCSGQQGAQGAAGPAASAQFAQGTVQGALVDSVTLQPIVGAVVDIGVAQATTTANGQFTFTNIPVPVDAANNGKATDYKVTINLTRVSSPVNMVSPGTSAVYPNYSLKIIPIAFTSQYNSLVTASGVTATGGTTATPQNGLVATIGLGVGKLSAGISGVVGDAATLQPVGTGYTVQLTSTTAMGFASAGTGTGTIGNVVATTTTGANGSFSFSNIEANQNFTIVAFDSTQSKQGSVAATSPADGLTKTLAIQQAGVAANSLNQTVLVSATDNRPPSIITVSPQNNADIAPAANGIDVIIKFSEPIKQDAYATALTASASVNGGIYNDVSVNFLGAKASNIAHTLAWNAAFDQLTVNIPGAAISSKYSVVLGAGFSTSLKDAAGNLLSAAPVTTLLTGGTTLNFTTSGSATPLAPIAVTNTVTPGVIVAASRVPGSASLNWLPAANAKAYNVYRTQTVGSVTYPAQLIGVVAPATYTTLLNSYADAAIDFVNTALYGFNKVTYSYMVKSVGFDLQESVASSSVSAADTVAPTLAAVTPITVVTAIAVPATPTVINVTFSEPLDPATATVAGNYTIGVSVPAVAPALTWVTATVSKATLIAPNVVQLSLTPGVATATTATALTGNQTLIVGANAVKDISGNAFVQPAAAPVF